MSSPNLSIKVGTCQTPTSTANATSSMSVEPAPPSEKFDVDLFESRLEALKDTQEGIQQMSAWCLQQRANHKRIVASWLNVFKRVRVEHRLTLFYLANDVIQSSKRRPHEFVESWATAIQKATTMVRDEKVKNKILRIFNIWGQREIYNEEYLSDLCGLLNIAPLKKTTQSGAIDSDEFQNANLIANIKECIELSEATDKSFRKLPKSPDCNIELIKQQLKDKSHSVDIEHELERYMTYIEVFNKNLQTEIKSRKTVISQLEKAIKFYSNQLSEVKVVVSAYKNFGSRIKLVKKKAEEMTPNLSSPLPSPDINAPSPEPDADIQLPDDHSTNSMPENNFNGYSYLNPKGTPGTHDFSTTGELNSSINRSIEVINSRSDSKAFTGDTDYYKHESIGTINAYSGANNVEIPGLNSIPVPAVPSGGYTSLARSSQQFSDAIQASQQNQPLFGITGGGILDNSNTAANNEADTSYDTSLQTCGNFATNSRYNTNVYENNQGGRVDSTDSSTTVQPLLPPPPIPAPVMSIEAGGSLIGSAGDFNTAWNLNLNWTNSLSESNSAINNYGPDIVNRPTTSVKTSISPPNFNHEVQNSKSGSLEYAEHGTHRVGPVDNVDRRHLHLQPQFGCNTNMILSKDIDHRNLISLTGSPGSNDNEKKKWQSGANTNVPEMATQTGNQSPLKGSEKKNSGIQTKKGGMGSESADSEVVDMDMSDEDHDDICRDKNDNRKLLHSSPSDLEEVNHTSNPTASMKTENSHQVQRTPPLDNCSSYGTNARWNTSHPRDSINLSNTAEVSGEVYSLVSTNETDLNKQHSDWGKTSWAGNEERLSVQPMQFPYGNMNECGNPSVLGVGNTLNSNRDGSYGRNSNRGWTNTASSNQYNPFSSSRMQRGVGGNVLHGPSSFYNRGGARLTGHTGILRANNFRTKTRGKTNWI